MRISLVAALCCSLLISACDPGTALSPPPPMDLAAEPLPFSLQPMDAPETLPAAPALPPAVQADLALRRDFFAQRFAPLDRTLSEARAAALTWGEEAHLLQRFIEGVESSQLAGLDACTAWLASMPDSYVAHLSCGEMWRAAAWAARSNKTVDQITPVRFAMMRERFARANALLEKALTLTPKPTEALTALASNHFAGGSRDVARSYLERAEALAPAYSELHSVRLNFLLPQWGGSEEKQVAAIARATAAGVSPEQLSNFHDQYIARPWKLSNPGAERAYWEAAIVKQPTFYRMRSLVNALHRMANWRDGLPAATRLIEAYPNDAEGYRLRAQAQERLGFIPEALADYRAAAARGHDGALQDLIQAHVKGGLGLPPQDWQALGAVCRYGAALGLPSGANCVGSLFWEGGRVGATFPSDPRQSLAWHLVGARAGYHNSQYDLGWLLMTGRAPGVDPARGQQLGLFWLRRAAELDHEFAKKKLQEGGHPESEPVGEGRAALARWLELAEVLF